MQTDASLIEEALVTTPTWVVGVDGSDDSRTALAWAVAQATGRDAQIVALCTWLAPILPSDAIGQPALLMDWDRFEAELRRHLEEIVASVRTPGVAVGPAITARVEQGRAAQTLIENSREAELLVVGTKGREGLSGVMLGSISRKCATHAAVPVAVVPAGVECVPIRRLVVGYDGSRNAKDAVKWALRFAPSSAQIDVVRAVELVPWLDQATIRERFPTEVEKTSAEFEVEMNELDPARRGAAWLRQYLDVARSVASDRHRAWKPSIARRQGGVVFNRIIVPTDGSDYSWRAVAVGEALARQCDAPLEVFEVVTFAADVKRAEQLISERLANTPLSIPASACARVMQRSVGFTIADHVTKVEGGMLVMSTFGRGRTEAILGSVAADVVREMFGPLVVVGPKARTDRTDLRGELIVPVDGSDFSETTLALGAAWGIGLGARPWVVAVLEPDQVRVDDTTESSYAARLARDIRRVSHHDVQFEVLHGNHPGTAIAEFAESIGASLIVATTHGRTGLARLTLGSVAMEIVRHAPCPVVLTRPPTLPRQPSGTVRTFGSVNA